MCNLVKGHLIDVAHLRDSIYRNRHHTFGISLQHAHSSAGEVGYEHAEGYWDEQKGLVLFHDAEIQQRKGKQVHYYEQGILRYGRECCHLVQLVDDIIKHFHS